MDGERTIDISVLSVRLYDGDNDDDDLSFYVR